jgi:hypothetical protein
VDVAAPGWRMQPWLKMALGVDVMIAFTIQVAANGRRNSGFGVGT